MNADLMRKALAAASFGVPFVIYMVSLTPSVGFWDTAEMQTVPYILGIAHPTGFPAFVLLGYLFSHLVAIVNVAWRLSLMSAIAMAAAAWLIFLTLRDEGVDAMLASLSAWTFAFGSVVWTRGTRAEVHALVILFIGAAIWAALRARATRAIAPLYICALALGLAAATHPVMIWTLPGVAILLFVGPQGKRRYQARELLLAGALATAPLLLYLYMPLRSAFVASRGLDPTLALGLPPGQAFWDWGHPAGWQNFVRFVTGGYYPKNGALGAILHPSSYASLLQTFAERVFDEFGALAIALMVIGFTSTLLKDRVKALSLALIALAGVPFALRYTVETDYDRYLLTAYWTLALFLGYGAQAITASLKVRGRASIATAVVTVTLLVDVGYIISTNRAAFAQTSDHTADALIDRTVRQTPDRSIVVASWVYATPLAYGAYVERRLGRRVVISAEPEELTTLIRQWRAKRPVYLIFFRPLGETVRSLDGLRLIALKDDSPTIYGVAAIPRGHHQRMRR